MSCVLILATRKAADPKFPVSQSLDAQSGLLKTMNTNARAFSLVHTGRSL